MNRGGGLRALVQALPEQTAGSALAEVKRRVYLGASGASEQGSSSPVGCVDEELHRPGKPNCCVVLLCGKRCLCGTVSSVCHQFHCHTVPQTGIILSFIKCDLVWSGEPCWL